MRILSALLVVGLLASFASAQTSSIRIAGSNGGHTATFSGSTSTTPGSALLGVSGTVTIDGTVYTLGTQLPGMGGSNPERGIWCYKWKLSNGETFTLWRGCSGGTGGFVGTIKLT